MNRQGFALYLTFLVTTVVFMLVTAGQTISRLSLDMGRTDVLETIVFHAADGALEKGIAHLRGKFQPFDLAYEGKLDNNRDLKISLAAKHENPNNKVLTLRCNVSLFEGNTLLIKKTYMRSNIENQSGRNGIGRFMEVR
ncbi:MAG: hypothetical protein PHF29_00935 [Candidatus Riflebacteria bacterium]|nr:hypothetical protein [Candidatus Riflebacteria bacterium]